MLQSSITAWLKKPATVTKVEQPAEKAAEAPPPKASTPEPPAPASKETSHVSKISLPPLPPNVELVPLTKELLPAYKRLNTLTLPVNFGNTFYAESLTEPIHSITLIATWRSNPVSSSSQTPADNPPRVVGAIRCRLLPSSILYIAAISILAPYRSHGIATHLLHNIMVKAAKEHGVNRVTGHVWEANEDALEWYEKRGFEVLGKEESYYKKLKPAGAMLIVKYIKPTDFLAVTDTARTATE